MQGGAGVETTGKGDADFLADRETLQDIGHGELWLNGQECGLDSQNTPTGCRMAAPLFVSAPMRLSWKQLLITALLVAPLSVGARHAYAQPSNPRFGRWLLKSDAPAPASNIMTYEPLGSTGMKVTIQAVNARGDTTRWSYATDFDGRDMPVTGNASQTHAAVRPISSLVNEIVNKSNGRVTQRLTNVLSPDFQTIAVIYMREDADGKTTGVTFATYTRMPL